MAIFNTRGYWDPPALQPCLSRPAPGHLAAVLVHFLHLAIEAHGVRHVRTRDLEGTTIACSRATTKSAQKEGTWEQNSMLLYISWYAYNANMHTCTHAPTRYLYLYIYIYLSIYI